MNKCKTYFHMTGYFEPDIITTILGLEPFDTSRCQDTMPNGKPYDKASWSYGLCDEYDVYTENQMHKTLEKLIDKIDILNQIREKFEAEFYLEIVPEIKADGIHPCISPSLKVIDFCHATRTNIDIDLYII